MRVRTVIAAVLVFTFGATAAFADGLLYQLPKDGTWVKYDLVAVDKQGSQTMLGKGTIRMASVGQVTVEGQPCRWIEVAFRMSIETPRGTKRPESVRFWKVLIPEKYLVKGEAPLDHAVRAWVLESGPKQTAGKPRPMKEVKAFAEGPLPLILSGPPKDARPLDKEEVDSKLGKLACEGVSGVLEFKEQRTTIRITPETRLNAKAPFGVVGSRWTIERGMEAGTKSEGDAKTKQIAKIRSSRQEWNLKLTDFGDGAKSELPDAQ